jgi:uncharacterized Zn finger protein (UPF0148 family)
MASIFVGVLFMIARDCLRSVSHQYNSVTQLTAIEAIEKPFMVLGASPANVPSCERGVWMHTLYLHSHEMKHESSGLLAIVVHPAHVFLVRFKTKIHETNTQIEPDLESPYIPKADDRIPRSVMREVDGQRQACLEVEIDGVIYTTNPKPTPGQRHVDGDTICCYFEDRLTTNQVETRAREAKEELELREQIAKLKRQFSQLRLAFHASSLRSFLIRGLLEEARAVLDVVREGATNGQANDQTKARTLQVANQISPPHTSIPERLDDSLIQYLAEWISAGKVPMEFILAARSAALSTGSHDLNCDYDIFEDFNKIRGNMPDPDAHDDDGDDEGINPSSSEPPEIPMA